MDTGYLIKGEKSGEKPLSVDFTERQNQKARIIKANHVLQAKVGIGPLDEKAVLRAQKVIESNTYDFAPLAGQYLARFAATLRSVKEGELTKRETVDSLTETVMQLKANASIFRYVLIGRLATIMLGFLESVERMDEEAIEIVEAHYKTLKAIVAKKMEGKGGTYGQKLEAELKDVIKRYFAKRKS